MSGGVIAIAVAIAGVVAVAQSTVLQFASIAGVQPDLVLIIVVYVANRNGSMTGQLAGLGAGIVLDLMGLSPLGFYALIYAVIGAAFGITRGKMFVDPVFLPVLFSVVGLLAEVLLALLLSGLFGIEGVSARVFSADFLIEVGYTAVLAPVFFGLLKLISPLRPDRRRGEGL